MEIALKVCDGVLEEFRLLLQIQRLNRARMKRSIAVDRWMSTTLTSQLHHDAISGGTCTLLLHLELIPKHLEEVAQLFVANSSTS